MPIFPNPVIWYLSFTYDMIIHNHLHSSSEASLLRKKLDHLSLLYDHTIVSLDSFFSFVTESITHFYDI